MKKIVLLLAILLLGCTREEEAFTPPAGDVNDFHLDEGPLPYTGEDSGRNRLWGLLGTADATTYWNTPWWIQNQLDGLGIHYGSNPHGIGNYWMTRDHWLRNRAWLFIKDNGEKFIIIQGESNPHTTFWVVKQTEDGPPSNHWSKRSNYLSAENLGIYQSEVYRYITRELEAVCELNDDLRPADDTPIPAFKESFPAYFEGNRIADVSIYTDHVGDIEDYTDLRDVLDPVYFRVSIGGEWATGYYRVRGDAAFTQIIADRLDIVEDPGEVRRVVVRTPIYSAGGGIIVGYNTEFRIEVIREGNQISYNYGERSSVEKVAIYRGVDNAGDWANDVFVNYSWNSVTNEYEACVEGVDGSNRIEWRVNGRLYAEGNGIARGFRPSPTILTKIYYIDVTIHRGNEQFTLTHFIERGNVARGTIRRGKIRRPPR